MKTRQKFQFIRANEKMTPKSINQHSTSKSIPIPEQKNTYAVGRNIRELTRAKNEKIVSIEDAPRPAAKYVEKLFTLYYQSITTQLL